MVLFIISIFYNKLFPLWSYFGVFLVVFTTVEFIKEVRATEWWKGWFGGDAPSFVQDMLRKQLLLIVSTFIVFFVLLLIKKRPSQFYLSMGDLNARVKPVKCLAVQENYRWQRFGREIGVYLSIGLLIYLLSVNGVPSVKELRQVVRYIPVIMLFAVINSFYEELVYRASFLSVLEGVAGERHSLFLTTFYFGIGHFYGVPTGIVGILMASFLGYILGKACLRQEGFFGRLCYTSL